MTNSVQYNTNIYRPGELNLPKRMENILSMSPSPENVEIQTWASDQLDTQRETRRQLQANTIHTERWPRKPLHWQPMARTKHRPATRNLRYRTTRFTRWMATPHRQLHRRFQSAWLSIKHDLLRRRPRRGSYMVQNHPSDIYLRQRDKTRRF